MFTSFSDIPVQWWLATSLPWSFSLGQVPGGLTQIQYTIMAVMSSPIWPDTDLEQDLPKSGEISDTNRVETGPKLGIWQTGALEQGLTRPGGCGITEGTGCRFTPCRDI